jgi:hypothetical protein
MRKATLAGRVGFDGGKRARKAVMNDEKVTGYEQIYKSHLTKRRM